MLKHYEDSKKYLVQYPELVCEDTANYLVVWCIDLEIEEVKVLFLKSNFIHNKGKYIFISLETRSNGARCSPVHCHAVYSRVE